MQFQNINNNYLENVGEHPIYYSKKKTHKIS